MLGKAFGKFYPEKPLTLRMFEVRFKIESREGAAAWKSSHPSVQNLLDHLKRYTQSESSREKYLRHLLQFSRLVNLSPKELVKLPKKRVELLVQGFADELAAKDRSKAYVNSVIKRLRRARVS